MITLFNRTELCTTFDIQRMAQLRDILEANGIDYKVELDNPVRSITRGHAHSNLGVDLEKSNLYYIYVNKSDLNRAKYLINLK